MKTDNVSIYMLWKIHNRIMNLLFCQYLLSVLSKDSLCHLIICQTKKYILKPNIKLLRILCFLWEKVWILLWGNLCGYYCSIGEFVYTIVCISFLLPSLISPPPPLYNMPFPRFGLAAWLPILTARFSLITFPLPLK